MRPKASRTCGKTRYALPQRVRCPQSCSLRARCSAASHSTDMPGPATLLCSLGLVF